MESRGPELQAVIISFLILSWVTVLARCWVRIKMIKAFALDDWFTVLTLLLFTIYTGVVFVGVYWGCGRHMRDLTTYQRINAMHAWYYGEIFYILTATCLRFAVGAFLLRVAVRKSHRNIVFGCIAINIVFNLYYLFFTIFQCTPLNGFWLRMGGLRHVKCHTNIAVDSTYASSVVSAFIDWVFGLLPIAIIWDLHINMRKKIALGIVMGLGAVASAAPLIRIPYTTTLSHSEDFLWSTTDVAIWSYVEPGVGLVVISLVALRPLFNSLFKGLSIYGTAENTRTKQLGSNGGPRASTRPSTRPSIRQGGWDHNDDELQLQGLPPRMGHTVSIEGGTGLRDVPAKLQKSPSSSSKKGSRTPSSGRSSGEKDEHTITRTRDFKSWSDNDLSQQSILPKH